MQYTGEADALQQATSVVLLGSAAPEGKLGDAVLAEQQTVLVLAGAFDDRSGGVVVAGPTGSSADSGLLRVLRDDSGVAGRVSSVDNDDRGVGQIAVVRALAEQLRGAVGAYGAGAGAAGPLPSPAP